MHAGSCTRERIYKICACWHTQLHAERQQLIIELSTLLQSEYGDIYKVTLDYEGETVTEVKVKYFDTIPPCASICVLKTGFLFAASEYGNHGLYQFVVSGGGAEQPHSRIKALQTSVSAVIKTTSYYIPYPNSRQRGREGHGCMGLEGLRAVLGCCV